MTKPQAKSDRLDYIFMRYEGWHTKNGYLIDWPEEAKSAIEALIRDARIKELEWVDQNYSNEMFDDWFLDRLAQLKGAKDEV